MSDTESSLTDLDMDVPTTPPPTTNWLLAAYFMAVENCTDKTTRAMREMSEMIVHREVELRDPRATEAHKDRCAGCSVNWEAAMAQCTGMESGGEMVCSHCRRGYGPYTTCVVSLGRFGGSCGNCHFNSMGGRCSNRPPPPAAAAADDDDEEEEEAMEVEEGEEEEEEVEEGEEEEEEVEDARASARYARLSARRMHRLLIMAATSFDAAAAGLASMARVAAMVADEFAAEAGFEEVGDEDLDDMDREILELADGEGA